MEYCQVVKALAFDANIQRFESFYSNMIWAYLYINKFGGIAQW